MIEFQQADVENGHVFGLKLFLQGVQQRVVRRYEVKRVDESQAELLVDEFVGQSGAFHLLATAFKLCLCVGGVDVDAFNGLRKRVGGTFYFQFGVQLFYFCLRHRRLVLAVVEQGNTECQGYLFVEIVAELCAEVAVSPSFSPLAIFSL